MTDSDPKETVSPSHTVTHWLPALWTSNQQHLTTETKYNETHLPKSFFIQWMMVKLDLMFLVLSPIQSLISRCCEVTQGACWSVLFSRPQHTLFIYKRQKFFLRIRNLCPFSLSDIILMKGQSYLWRAHHDMTTLKLTLCISKDSFKNNVTFRSTGN